MRCSFGFITVVTAGSYIDLIDSYCFDLGIHTSNCLCSVLVISAVIASFYRFLTQDQ